MKWTRKIGQVLGGQVRIVPKGGPALSASKANPDPMVAMGHDDETGSRPLFQALTMETTLNSQWVVFYHLKALSGPVGAIDLPGCCAEII